MLHGDHSIRIPNLHGHEIRREFLGRILKPTGNAREEYENL
jgi:hypothetical protein